MKKHKKAFTLVELIVVLTIIAILGIIAFISLQGYSSSARNSTRVSDLSSMKKSLELFHLDAGKYPETTNGFIVTYSGTEVWTQGIFGETTKSNVEKLDKIPKDPLTEKEYTYSLTKTKQEYELAGLVEGDEIVLNNNKLLNETNAAGNVVAKAVVTGNYNGALFKSETGTTCEVLSVPSIISSEGSTTTDLKTILDSKSLVYNGYNNLPSNYIGGKYKTDGGFEFESKKLIVYSDTQECKPLYAENPTVRIELIKNLQTAYSGTIIEDSGNIRGLVELDVNDITTLISLSATLVNNNLGGEITSYTSDVLICNTGEHTEDGINCIPNIGICDIVNGTGINTWNGTSWDCTVNTCNTGYTQIGESCTVNTYTVTFNENGGTIPNPATKTVAHNLEVGILPTTSKTGYIFNGWFTAETGGIQVTTSTIITGAVTFYAQWGTCVYSQCKIYIDDAWAFWASPKLITGTPGGMSTTLISTDFNGGSAYFNFYYNTNCGVYRERMSGTSTMDYLASENSEFEILLPGQTRGRAGVPNTSYSSNESVCN